MRSADAARGVGLVASASAAVVVAACHHAPDEQLTSLDAASPRPSASALASTADAAAADAFVAPPATRAFCDAAYSADQDRMRAKCSIADFAVIQGGARAAANLCVRDFDGMLERGHVVFDQARADACVQMLRANTADRASETDTFFAHAPCDEVLTGRQGVGQACLLPVECKEGLTCVGYRVGIEGTCKATAKTKEACSPQVFGATFNLEATSLHHPPCRPADWCDGTVCSPRIAAGKACTAAESCAAGLSCVMGKCARRGQPGEACQKPADCMFQLRCESAGDGGVGSGKCANRKAEGEDCTNPDECKGSCSTPAGKGGAAPVGKCVSVCGSG